MARSIKLWFAVWALVMLASVANAAPPQPVYVTGVVTNGNCVKFSTGVAVADAGVTCGGSGGNPLAIGTAQIGSGTGAPPIATDCTNSAGEASLCLRTDTGILYSMWTPPTVIPAAVQSQAVVNSYTVTMTSTPTPGNYLIALCYNMTAAASVPTLSAGWTSITTHTGSLTDFEGSANVAYLFVAPGTTTSQTPCSGSPGTGNGVTVVEVSGLDGVNFTNSLQFSGFATAEVGGATATATVATTSTAGNSFGLSLPWAGGYGSGIFTGGTGTPTFNAGWTTGASANAGFAGASTTVISASELSPSNGSTISAQASANSARSNRISNILLVLQPSSNSQTTGFQPVSYLTTIKSAGSTITSAGRSLNFSTCMSASADAQSNVTVTAAQVAGCVPASALASTGVTASTYGDATHVAQITVNAGGQITSASNVAISGAGGGSTTIVGPQGRLTLASGTPVMTSDQTAKSTVYYDCFTGNNVPYYDGSTDKLDTIGACEVSTTMQTTSTGVTNSGGVFDVWWVHGGASRICVATNGSGGGWASDTGGSNTARGSGYSAVHNTRGYWTNTSSISHCYNGSTDYGSVSADQATYLGTLTTTAAGQTGMAFHPAAASGGAAPVLGLWNAYNRVTFTSTSVDSGTWSYTTNAWRMCHASSSDKVSWVDGLGQSVVRAHLHMMFESGVGFNMQWVMATDWTSGTPTYDSTAGGSAPTAGYTTAASSDANTSTAPLIGLHAYDCVEDNNGGGTYSMNTFGTFPIQISLEM